jgi:hypothetical protein
MMQLKITKTPLKKVGKRGHYTKAEKQELLSIPEGNSTVYLQALASKFNRDFTNVRRTYYRLKEEHKEIADKEIAKRESKTMHKREVTKHNPIDNAWTEFETELVIEALDAAENKTAAARDLAEVIDRTPDAIKSRYKYVKDKEPKKEVIYDSKSPDFVPLDFNIPSFIPETKVPTFIEEEQVKMYRATLADSLHDKPSDAVKANIRAIFDSMPDKDAEDSIVHLWFNMNKEKVEYLLNTEATELW